MKNDLASGEKVRDTEIESQEERTSISVGRKGGTEIGTPGTNKGKRPPRDWEQGKVSKGGSIRRVDQAFPTGRVNQGQAARRRPPHYIISAYQREKAVSKATK